MTTKDEVLQQITQLAMQGALQKNEMLSAYDAACLDKTNSTTLAEKNAEKTKVATILYYIGGAILFFGVLVFLQQQWSVLSVLTRILSTLGAGLLAYCIGSLFLMRARTAGIGSAFFLISALLMPLGLYEVFNHFGYNVSQAGPQSLIFAFLFILYLSSFLVFKKNIFILFATIFASALFFNVSYFLKGDDLFLGNLNFATYLTLIIGFSYLLLGYYFSQRQLHQVLWFFYGVGIVFFLGSALYLGEKSQAHHLLWTLLFPFFVFGSLFFSVRLKSQALLTFGTLFLLLYLAKLTGEYFSNNIGWAFSLGIVGLSIIAVGYLFFLLKKNMPA